MSSHQALGQSDSGIVSRYTVSCKVPLHKGLKCVYFTFLLNSILHFFYCLPFILFSAFTPPHTHLSSVVDSSESRLQQAEGQESGGAGTNDLLAAQGLRERETVNEIRKWI